MIKKLYDKCVTWAGHKYANRLLAFVAFIESSFFPAPPDVMIIPMTVAKRERFVKIALIDREDVKLSIFFKKIPV